MIVCDSDELVSVILPVYNCEIFVSLAIESVLNQTYKNIELIIINDGSTDGTHAAIEPYLADERVKYIHRENKGLVYSLNEGIKLASGCYIARMDADDVCLPERLRKQVSFIREHADVAIVGTRVILINELGKFIGVCHRPTTKRSINSYFYYGSPLAHPSVMYNMKILGKDTIRYDENDFPAEDLALFLRVVKVYNVANLRERLLMYRVNSSGISNSNKHKQLSKSNVLRLKYYDGCCQKVNFVAAMDSRDGSVLEYICQLTMRLVNLVWFDLDLFDVPSVLMIYLKAIRRRILM